MKAIYRRRDILCVIVEEYGDSLTLEPVDGDEDERFSVSLADPNLVLDPTDGEIDAIKPLEV